VSGLHLIYQWGSNFQLNKTKVSEYKYYSPIFCQKVIKIRPKTSSHRENIIMVTVIVRYVVRLLYLQYLSIRILLQVRLKCILCDFVVLWLLTLL